MAMNHGTPFNRLGQPVCRFSRSGIHTAGVRCGGCGHAHCDACGECVACVVCGGFIKAEVRTQ